MTNQRLENWKSQIEEMDDWHVSEEKALYSGDGLFYTGIYKGSYALVMSDGLISLGTYESKDKNILGLKEKVSYYIYNTPNAMFKCELTLMNNSLKESLDLLTNNIPELKDSIHRFRHILSQRERDNYTCLCPKCHNRT